MDPMKLKTKYRLASSKLLTIYNQGRTVYMKFSGIRVMAKRLGCYSLMNHLRLLKVGRFAGFRDVPLMGSKGTVVWVPLPRWKRTRLS